jgi:hypothetical protein
MALHGVGLRLGGVLSARSRAEALGLDVSFLFSSRLHYAVSLHLGGVLSARSRIETLGPDSLPCVFVGSGVACVLSWCFGVLRREMIPRCALF